MLAPAPRRWVTFNDALVALSAVPPRRPAARPVEASAGGWLDRVRVLDLGNVIAGPHSASYLARFGAEVMDPTSPLFDRWIITYGMINLRGKRSTLVDITSPNGRKVFERLLKSVDAVVWNATDRQVRDMGLDPEGMKALNPHAILCKLDCFGGVRPGPLTDQLGFDDLAQAVSGIMLRFGGSMETPEEHANLGTIDLLGGRAGPACLNRSSASISGGSAGVRPPCRLAAD